MTYEEEVRDLWARDPNAVLQRYLRGLHDMGLSYAKFERAGYPISSKPILGGVFGAGGYSIASQWTRHQKLDYVSYFVMHDESRFICARGDNIEDALDAGRLLLQKFSEVQLSVAFANYKTALAAEIRAATEENARKFREYREANPTVTPIKSIPKRRQKIFDESEGKCHYCGTALTLDGRWHIEHKMPRALMGTNEPGNLVAACVACNMKKRDTTDIEFKAKLAAKGAA